MLSLSHAGQVSSLKYMRIWLPLSFQAGAINAGAFLACHRFVTHVTGFVTLFGTSFAEKKYLDSFGYLCLPLFFLLGAIISGLLVDRRLIKKLKPRHTSVLALIVACLATVTFLGHFGFFGSFGKGIEMSKDYILLALLCLASGLQNAMTTSMSFSIVRNTHLTGPLTDLGLGLVRTFFHDVNEEEKQKEKSMARLRLLSIFSFIVGTWISALFFFHYGYLVFLLPTLTAALILFFELNKSHAEGKTS